MSLPRNQAWFPLKTYGYGWGPPRRWQGWAVLAGYVAALAGGAFFLMTPGETAWYAGYIGAVSVMLIAICYWKGEAPRWRWGEDTGDNDGDARR
ncbi:MAG TPA: hypothetical protein VG838_11305 [Opitutaceae bacterium]|nr:hypothetical protein [Opitutaceae bacterium]